MLVSLLVVWHDWGFALWAYRSPQGILLAGLFTDWKRLKSLVRKCAWQYMQYIIDMSQIPPPSPHTPPTPLIYHQVKAIITEVNERWKRNTEGMLQKKKGVVNFWSQFSSNYTKLYIN